MKNKKIVIIILISIVVFLLFYLVYSLNSENVRLEKEYDEYKKQSNKNIEKLESDLNSLEKEKNEIEESYQNLNLEVDEVIKKIEDYENELNESIKWFKDNSILKNESIQKKTTFFLDNVCFKKIDGKCHIKTGCFFLTNLKQLGYTYKNDTDTSESYDKLQSLNEFINNSGGDCEDYALFFKAEYNYILEKCKGIEPSNITIESWVEDEDSYDRYWLNFVTDWYIRGAEAFYLKDGYINPVVICGDIYDFNSDKVWGHCILAFTKNKIKSKEDLNELNKAPVIEPQNGIYMGLINDYSSNIFLINRNNYNVNFNSRIYIVITDEDYFLFSFDKGEWMSYSIFLNDLNDKKMDLLNIR